MSLRLEFIHVIFTALFPVISYKIVVHLMHGVCTFKRTTELVQFIEITARHCRLTEGEVETGCAGLAVIPCIYINLT